MTRNTEQMVWSKVEKQPDGGCWEWCGYLNSDGYGRIMIQGKPWTTHRLAWHLLRGGFTPGLQLDHLCRNRRCCNPDHLEEVTGRENILRGAGVAAINARKTHCAHGHEFTGKNTYFLKKTNGKGKSRVCRECKKLAARRRKAITSREANRP